MISIIVCTYNREKFLSYCLNSLIKQNCDSDEYEVIIINNNSTDNTHNICTDFLNKNKIHNIRYFIETKQGLSYARNTGVLKSKGDVLAFVDDDAIVCENYIRRLKSDFCKSDFFAGGGKILPKWESKRPKWMSRFLLSLTSVINLGDKKILFKNKYPIGANMFFKRSIFDEVGFFNTKLGRIGKNMLGGEEKDLFYRIFEKGYQIIYIPDVWVYHIIPDERIQISFIKKQALGIGESEKIRTTGRLFDRSISLVKEFIKWVVSIFLFLFYFLIFNFHKGFMLLRFRWWVSKGMLTRQKT